MNNNIKILEDYQIEYLRDESRRVGSANTISFPKTQSEVVNIVLSLVECQSLITIQGARTGITAGAVPEGGHIMNLIKMNKITGLRYDEVKNDFYMMLQPGVLLTDVKKILESKNFDTKNWSQSSIEALEVLKNSGKYFFSPDPTETTASIGGMVACNASGACSFKYGATRKYIEALKVVLVDGNILELKRGKTKANGRNFSVKLNFGKILNGNIPSYNMPNVKNASGYYAKEDMEIIDLFIGSEGTLGIITEIEIKLLSKPAFIYGMTSFFRSEEAALNFVRAVRGDSGEEITKPAALEYFNHNALKLLKSQKLTNPSFNKLPDIRSHYHTAIYTEYHGESKDSTMQMLMDATAFMTNYGGDEGDTWVATNDRDMERLHFFRHATPEAVNLIIDGRRVANPSITKLGTDMAVPDEYLENVVNLYNSSVAEEKLESVMFGHIGNNHIHVNIIPKNIEEYHKGKELYNSFAKEVIAMGGTVSAEHGIGKMKTVLLKEMFGDAGIMEMIGLKKLFDPELRLGKGNIFNYS
ncbi:MAG TPA: FAD-binding oxidoreductase [Clostridia bacterium]|nr:FAD-binding oxidoreductase [Clostridia bacterium]